MLCKHLIHHGTSALKVAFVGTVLFHVILLSLLFLILTYTYIDTGEHGPEPYLFKVMRPEENEESNLAKVHLIRNFNVIL